MSNDCLLYFGNCKANDGHCWGLYHHYWCAYVVTTKWCFKASSVIHRVMSPGHERLTLSLHPDGWWMMYAGIITWWMMHRDITTWWMMHHHLMDDAWRHHHLMDDVWRHHHLMDDAWRHHHLMDDAWRHHHLMDDAFILMLLNVIRPLFCALTLG